MSENKTRPQTKLPKRERVLDAAERLLAEGSAAFSMRDLAQEAGVSFATPFNRFGSKAAIMLALSARRIASMREGLAAARLAGGSVARVLAAVEIGVSVMLTASTVNRAVMGAIGGPSDAPDDVLSRSRALWSDALGAGEDLAYATRALALATLPDQLAIAFRGVLSFWTAGEIPDGLLGQRAGAAAATVLLGFAEPDGQNAILALLTA